MNGQWEMNARTASTTDDRRMCWVGTRDAVPPVEDSKVAISLVLDPDLERMNKNKHRKELHYVSSNGNSGQWQEGPNETVVFPTQQTEI